MGGKERNKHAKAKLRAGRGPIGKTAIAGIRDRNTNHVVAKVVGHTDKKTLQGFIRENDEVGATVFTDEAKAYENMPEFSHDAVKHSVGEYVRDMAPTNGMESFGDYVGKCRRPLGGPASDGRCGGC